MIYGIGVDVLEMARVQASLVRFGHRFAVRVLGPRELLRFDARHSCNERRGVAFLATRFAAKEAVAKALGLGMRTPMTWRALEIDNDSSGRPVVIAHGALREFLATRRLRVHVSVSDERTVAIAYAIAEQMAD
ncbi:MAG: holo-ACP synthase [Sutterellaceae bacterium]|nr:holo-ACP synthase [Burkholderiaceae bacterium]MCX7901537.1 holo-ACP synthase [Burkholderiaceae bacterium]MDW8429807.1 holo-ACP synthase [Sutterellaceae bacterium]